MIISGPESGAQRHLGLYVCASAVTGMVVGNISHNPPVGPLFPIALFFMLWPVMLNIEPRNAVAILKAPKALALALLFNFALSPLLIFWLSRLCLSSAYLQLSTGMLLFGMMPCGGMVPAYTGMVRGNIELSIAVTAVSLLLSIVFVPLWTGFLINKTLAIPLILAAKATASTILLPLFFSWLLRKVIIIKKGMNTFDKVRSSLRSVSSYGLMLMVFSAFAINGENVTKDPFLIMTIGGLASTFLIILLAGSTVLGKMAGLGRSDAVALTISTTVKNNAVAMSLAVLLFDVQTTLVIAVAGSMAQLPVMLGWLKLYKRNHKTLSKREV